MAVAVVVAVTYGSSALCISHNTICHHFNWLNVIKLRNMHISYIVKRSWYSIFLCSFQFRLNEPDVYLVVFFFNSLSNSHSMLLEKGFVRYFFYLSIQNPLNTENWLIFNNFAFCIFSYFLCTQFLFMWKEETCCRIIITFFFSFNVSFIKYYICIFLAISASPLNIIRGDHQHDWI